MGGNNEPVFNRKFIVCNERFLSLTQSLFFFVEAAVYSSSKVVFARHHASGDFTFASTLNLVVGMR